MPLLTADFCDGTVREWHATSDGITIETNPDYTATFYIAGDRYDLVKLRERIATDPKVTKTAFVDRYPDLHAREPTTVLKIDVDRMDDVDALANEVRHHYEPQTFRPATFRLYNVDLSPQFRYCLETGIDAVPERDLRVLELELSEKALAEQDLAALTIDGEGVAGNEGTVLRVLQARLSAVDPDVLLLSTADLVPLLYDTADERGMDDFTHG